MPRLWFGRNVNHFRCDQFCIGDFGSKFDPLQTGLLFRFGEKRQQVLVIQAKIQFVQVRGEGDRRLKTEIERFTSRLLGDLGKVILAPVNTPDASPEAAYTASI